MGEELDKPKKEYSGKDNSNNYIKFGFNQVQGWKKSMEDYSIEFLEPDKDKFMNIFGIFDGHGGVEVPKYLQVHFLEFLKKNKNFIDEKYQEAFRETFFDLDKSFKTKEAQEELAKYSLELKPEKEKELEEINNLCSSDEKLNKEELDQVMAFNEVFDPRNIENANIAEFTGATGMIIAVCYNNILIINAGNSRCLVLDKNGKIIKKSVDHTMKDENEKKRVELARSFNDEDEEKKKGDEEHMEYLDSTRGFGDLEFKGNEWIEQKDQEVSVEPEIIPVPYDKAKYIIFGSHGMFEGDEKVNDKISNFFFDKISKNSEIKFSDVIKDYFEEIIAKEKNNEKSIGLDNMSCFVVELFEDEINAFLVKKDEEIKRKKKEEEERKKKAKEEEMKRRAEEKKKREAEKKRKEEEKKRKEAGEIIETPESKKDEIKPEDKKEESKIQETKEESKIIESKIESKIEETKGETKIEESKAEDKKEESKIEVSIEELKTEEKKEEANKDEIKNEIKEEEKKEENKIEENKIEEDKKEENKIEEEKKEENKIEEEKKEENKIVEEKKEENKIEEEKKEENKIEEGKIEEEKKEEDKKEENKIEEDKKEENKIEEDKKEDDKKEENKIEEDKKEDDKKEENKIVEDKKEENKKEDDKKEDKENVILEEKKEEKEKKE